MAAETAQIRKRIFVPFFMMLSVLLITLILSVYWIQRQHINQGVFKSLDDVEVLFHEELSVDSEILGGLIQSVAKDETIRNAWLTKDRDALLRRTAPFFGIFHTESKVTHLYFIDNERFCFLGLDNPVRQGDYIGHATMDKVAKEGNPVVGLELNRFGMLMIRSVHPWQIDKKVTGYIEIGKGIDHIVSKLKNIFDVELFVSVNKAYLEREKWEEGLKMGGRSGNWNTFNQYVIFYQTLEISSPEFNKRMNLSHTENGGTLVRVSDEKKTYLGGFIPLIDGGGSNIGEIFVLQDVSEQENSLRIRTFLLIVICVIVGGVLVGFFYTYLGKIERMLLNIQTKLQDEIQEHKQTSELHGRSEKEHRDLINNLPIGLFRNTPGPEGKFIMANLGIAQMFGYDSIEEFLETPVADLYQNRDERKTFSDELISQEIMVARDQRYKKKSGEKIWATVTARAVRDESGKIKYFDGSLQDVTKRRQAEDELQETKDFLDKIIDRSLDGIVAVDKQGCIIRVNPFFLQMLGYEEEEIIGKHTYELAPRADGEYESVTGETIHIDHKFFEDARKVVSVFREEGKIVNWETCLIRKDKKVVPVEENIVYLSDAQMDRAEAVAFIRDISERKKAEREVRETRDFLQNVIESSRDGIAIFDSCGLILSVNTSLERICRFKKKELVGKHFSMLSIDDDDVREMLIEKERELFEKGFTSYDSVQETSDGTRINVECNSSLIRDETGNCIAGVSIIRNISERKKIELQLLQTEKLKSLGELSSGVAHDLNNTLAAILGRAQLLKMLIDKSDLSDQKTVDLDEVKKGLSTIEKASHDGAETVRRIQEFSRSREDDQHFLVVDINKVINDSIGLTKVRWKDEAESRGIKITVGKSFSKGAFITGNFFELNEVFTCLLNNAIDAMHKDGEIRISTSIEGTDVVVAIADEGTGIQPLIVDKIFDPFFSTKGVKSTGLGLSVSYGIIKRHRGTISVESTEGKGTSFAIRFPVLTVEEERKEDTSEIEQKKGASILVIDDEETVREPLCDILLEGGNQVEWAQDGREGIDKFLNGTFDMVFTDLGMPGMTGWQVAAEVKKINKKVPVALITGWGIELEKTELQKSGVDLLLNKPFRLEQVFKLVEKCLQLKHSNETET